MANARKQRRLVEAAELTEMVGSRDIWHVVAYVITKNLSQTPASPAILTRKATL